MFQPADIEAVHEAALRVLARTGVLVQDDEAVALLAARGARAEGRRVYFDEGAVQAALAAAPPSFVLAGRSAARDLGMGGGRPVYGTGSGTAYVLDGDAPAARASRRRAHGREAVAPLARHRLHQRLHRAHGPARGGAHAPLYSRAPDPQRQGHRVDRQCGRRSRRRGRHQRDPVRRGMDAAPARPHRPEHERAAAALRGDGAPPRALGAPRPAGLRDGLRDGRHHRSGHARRDAGRAARGSAGGARAGPGRR